MNKNIINLDENGKYHGKQINYHSNGNIRWIGYYHHGKPNDYHASFYTDNRIDFKSYCNMGKWIYSEYHDDKQIKIRI